MSLIERWPLAIDRRARWQPEVHLSKYYIGSAILLDIDGSYISADHSL